MLMQMMMMILMVMPMKILRDALKRPAAMARGATTAFLAIILLQVFVWDDGDDDANDDDVDGDAIDNLARRS